MKLYGSFTNRFQENKDFTNGNIEVGTYATEYFYSDRNAYEVVKVYDQTHLVVRRLRAKRIDTNGMSECQDYEYTSEERNPLIELKLTKYGWKEIKTYGQWYIDLWEQRKDGWEILDLALLERVRKAVANGKTIHKYGRKWNISFGVADEYYDFSF